MGKIKKNKYKKNPVVLSIEEKRLLDKYNKFRIKSDTDVPAEECVFNARGVGCMPIGDLSAVKAEPKNGKTTALKRITATVLKGNLGQLSSDLFNPLIMWVDTEQKMSDAKLIIEDIDGKANGEYQSDTLDIDYDKAVQIGEGDNHWYQGLFQIIQNVKLRKK